MSDQKKEPLFGAREIIGMVGLISLGAGVAWFSPAIALIVVGIVLLAVAGGYVK